jgi:FkbM family methyltransferase
MRVWHQNPSRRLRNRLRGQQALTVVQIGSNDGKTDDPIHQLLSENATWNALLVEPIPFLFQRLMRNYAGRENTQFANVAIGESEGEMTFYYLEEALKIQMPDLPPWFDQLGSFDSEHIVKHLGEEIRPFVKTLNIPATPLSQLLQKHSITQIDLLHIDTEGYDWSILKQLDLKTYRPKVILFEYKHLSTSDRAAAVESLESLYQVQDLSIGGDYLCVRKQ